MASSDDKISLSDHNSFTDREGTLCGDESNRLPKTYWGDAVSDGDYGFTDAVGSRDSTVTQITNSKPSVVPVVSTVIRRIENIAKCEPDAECKPDTPTRPLIRSTFTFEVTRKRSRLDGDISPTGCTPSVLTSPLKRQTSLTSGGVTLRPGVESTSLDDSRSNSALPVKRPSSLPIPSQMFSARPTRARREFGDVSDTDVATSIAEVVPRAELNIATIRNVLSGRRILMNSTTSQIDVRPNPSHVHPEEQPHPFSRPPSPKRQRSRAQLHTESGPAIACRRGLTLNVPSADLTEAARHRREPLLHPTQPVYRDAAEECSDPREELWPPLVVDVHAGLTLQSNPPKSLLLSLLSEEGSPSELRSSSIDPRDPARKLHHVQPCHMYEGLFESSIDNHTVSLTSEKSSSHNEPRSLLHQPRAHPAGLTLAVTRNVHVHVHATELHCCSRKPAWCFASSGLQSFGQEEVVLVVQRRPASEQLPPLSIYRLYQQLYLAVSNRPAEPGQNESVTLVPSNKPTTGLFRAYDTFIPTRYFPHLPAVVQSQLNGHCADADQSRQCGDLSTTLPFGCLFFHPTHQCLVGLRLPATPFLVGLLFSKAESYWACHMPLRLLLRLGKSTRYYPTSLLNDLDREPLFNCQHDLGVLPWLHTLTTPPLSDSPASEQQIALGEQIPPVPLLLRVPGLHIRLISSCSSRSDPQLPGAQLELSFPVCQQPMLLHFLENLTSTCTVFAVAGDLDPSADSHLVCMQPTTEHDNSSQAASTTTRVATAATFQPFQSGAISIANTTRKVTGASFVAFIMSSTPHATVSMIEDGVLVQLPGDDFRQLVTSLSTNKNMRFDVPSSALSESLVSCVNLLWADEEEETAGHGPLEFGESDRASWIDMKCLRAERTYLVPPHYQLVHWLQPGLWLQPTGTTPVNGTTGATPSSNSLGPPSPRLAWARLHLLDPTTATLLEKRSEKSLDLGELVNQACGAIVQSLRPHANDLRRDNHTQLAVRVHLQPPDQVGYQVASLQPGLNLLVPVTATSIQPTGDMSSDESGDGRSPSDFSSSSDPHCCSLDLERYLIPQMRSWLSRIDFHTTELGTPSPTLTIENSAQLLFELDFYLLD